MPTVPEWNVPWPYNNPFPKLPHPHDASPWSPRPGDILPLGPARRKPGFTEYLSSQYHVIPIGFRLESIGPGKKRTSVLGEATETNWREGYEVTAALERECKTTVRGCLTDRVGWLVRAGKKKPILLPRQCRTIPGNQTLSPR